MKKKIPKFATEAEERLYWQNNDSSEYIGPDAEEAVFPRLKPSTRENINPSSRIKDRRIEIDRKQKRCPLSITSQNISSERIDSELHQ